MRCPPGSVTVADLSSSGAEVGGLAVRGGRLQQVLVMATRGRAAHWATDRALRGKVGRGPTASTSAAAAALCA